MKSLLWNVVGSKNKCNLILLHGWGSNSNIWKIIIPYLEKDFYIHLVDLPGYGENYKYGKLNLEEISEILTCNAPYGIWLGWSLGGLIATNIACKWPEKVNALVTVASSPRFCSEKFWPGINAILLKNFTLDLKKNFFHTMKKFFFLQTLGLNNKYKYINYLDNLLLKKYPLNNEALLGGLQILLISDLRLNLKKLSIPTLRIYGYLDSIVPRRVIPLVNKISKNSKSFIFKKSAHIPFMNYPNDFCNLLKYFNNKFIKY